jgi:predicted anti-sigma-YlaC factor YlaD
MHNPNLAGERSEVLMSVEAIVRGTPVWVWILLAYLLSRGLKALKGGTAPLSKLAIVPVVFAVWGIAHLVTEPAAGWKAGLAWVIGALIGVLAGVAIASRTAFTVDPVQRSVTLPGSVVPLALIVITFAMKFWIGFELATSAGLGRDSGYVVLDGLVSGVVAGIFAGRFLTYFKRFQSEGVVSRD